MASSTNRGGPLGCIFAAAALTLAAAAPAQLDLYESLGDSSSNTVNFISFNSSQEHTFHSAGDEDWIRFQIDEAGLPHTIRVTQQGRQVDAVLDFYFGGDLGSPVRIDDESEGPDDLEKWTFLNPPQGSHLLRITNGFAADNFAQTGYTVTFTGDWGPSLGVGTITTVKQLTNDDGGTLNRPGGGDGFNSLERGGASDSPYSDVRVIIPPGVLGGDFNAALNSPWDITNPGGGSTGRRPWTTRWGQLFPGNATLTEVILTSPNGSTGPPATFAQPWNIRLQYEPSDLGSGNIFNSALYVYNGQDWQVLDQSPRVDSDMRTVESLVGHAFWQGVVSGDVTSFVFPLAIAPVGGMGQTPSPTPSPTPTFAPTPSPTPRPTATPGPTGTPGFNQAQIIAGLVSGDPCVPGGQVEVELTIIDNISPVGEFSIVVFLDTGRVSLDQIIPFSNVVTRDVSVREVPLELFPSRGAGFDLALEISAFDPLGTVVDGPFLRLLFDVFGQINEDYSIALVEGLRPAVLDLNTLEPVDVFLDYSQTIFSCSGATPTPSPTPSPTPVNCTDIISNGGFELGQNMGWAETSSSGFAIVSEIPAEAHLGNWFAFFGAIEEASVDTLTQIVMPPARPFDELSFHLRIPSNEGFTQDKLEVRVDSTVVATFRGADAPQYADYTEVVLDLSPHLVNSFHNISFLAETASGSVQSFFVDTVSLVSCDGGFTPTPTPFPTSTPTPTFSPTPSPVPTASPIPNTARIETLELAGTPCFGGFVDIGIDVANNNQPVGEYNFLIKYDATALRLVDIQDADFGEDPVITERNPGTIEVFAFAEGSTFTSGPLLDLQFEVLMSGSSAIELERRPNAPLMVNAHSFAPIATALDDAATDFGCARGGSVPPRRQSASRGGGGAGPALVSTLPLEGDPCLPGGKYRVAVAVSGNPSFVGAYNLGISYDSSKLVIEKVRDLAFTANPGLGRTGNTLTVAASNDASDFRNGLLCELTFLVLDAAVDRHSVRVFQRPGTQLLTEIFTGTEITVPVINNLATSNLPCSTVQPTPVPPSLVQTVYLQRYGLGQVEDADFLPGSDRLVTGGGGGVVLWDLDQEKPLRILNAPGHYVNALAVSSDGNLVATGSRSGEVRIWYVPTGVSLVAFQAHALPIRDIIFNLDDSQVITAGADGRVRQWIPAASITNPVRQFIHTEAVNSLALSPEGTRLLAGSDDNTAVIWNLVNGAPLAVLDEAGSNITSTAFSPDGSEVLVGSDDRRVYRHRASDGQLLDTHEAGAGVTSLQYSADGTQYLLGRWSTVNRIIQISDGDTVVNLGGHSDRTLVARYSPDGSRIVTGARDNEVILYETGGFTEARRFVGHTAPVRDIAYGAGRDTLITGSVDGAANFWDAATGELIQAFRLQGSPLTSMALRGDGSALLAGSRDGRVKVIDAVTRTLLNVVSTGFESVFDVEYSPDGAKFIVGTGGDQAHLFDSDSLQEERVFGVAGGGDAESVALAGSGAGLRAAVADSTGFVGTYNASTGDPVALNVGHASAVRDVLMNNGFTRVLSASLDGTARLWNNSGGLLRTMIGHAAGLLGIDANSAFTRAVSAGVDSRVIYWDLGPGTALRFLLAHTSWVTDVLFGRGERSVFSASEDGTALLWELNPPRVVLISAGGNFDGNAIGEQTKALANYVYGTLLSRGYTPENILYLSAFGQIDATGDGIGDADEPATLETVREALTGEFAQGASRLLVVAINHGYATADFMALRLNETELLSTTQTNQWLNELQNAVPVNVTLVVDCCFSGRFVEDCRLMPGQVPADRKRTVIASTGPSNEAIFLPPPDLTSFTNVFFSNAYMGSSMGEAFRGSAQFFDNAFFSIASQMPVMDDNSGATVNADREFYGATWAYGVQFNTDVNGFFPAFDQITIPGTVSPGSAVIANVRLLPFQDPEEVTVSVRPPSPQVASGEPVAALRTYPLTFIGMSGNSQLWRTTITDNFTQQGAHRLSFNAKFPGGRVANPEVRQVVVSSTQTLDSGPIRAVLAIGDPPSSGMQNAFTGIGSYAFSVYLDRFENRADWITFLSPFNVRFERTHRDRPLRRREAAALEADARRTSRVAPTASSISNAISDAVSVSEGGRTIDRLYVHIVAESAADGVLDLGSGGVMSAAQLDAALDSLQSQRPSARVVVIIDAAGAGSFVAPLAAPNRAVIAGSDSGQGALFLSHPPFTSFTTKLLSTAYQGYHVRDGYRSGRDFLRTFLDFSITPRLDDDGDGAADKFDGDLSTQLYLGRQTIFPGSEASVLPLITSVSNPQVASAGTMVTLETTVAGGVAPNRVFGQFSVPAGGSTVTAAPSFDFTPVTSTLWRASVPAPFSPGLHTITIYGEYPDAATDRLSEPAFSAIVIPAVTDRDLVIRVLLGLDPGTLTLDANSDGIVDAADVEALASR